MILILIFFQKQKSILHCQVLIDSGGNKWTSSEIQHIGKEYNLPHISFRISYFSRISFLRSQNLRNI